MSMTQFPSFDSKFGELDQFILRLVMEYQRGNITSWNELEQRVNDFFTLKQMDEIEEIVPGW